MNPKPFLGFISSLNVIEVPSPFKETGSSENIRAPKSTLHGHMDLSGLGFKGVGGSGSRV